MSRYLFALLFLFACVNCSSQDWQDHLYLGNNGHWKQRIRVQATNNGLSAVNGEPVTLKVGSGPGEIQLTGVLAQSIRVCDSKGTEMLWLITDPSARPFTAGPIFAGSILTIPIECPAGSKTDSWVYFDNPSAWEVPDFLAGAGGLTNTGVELGDSTSPFGWSVETGDSTHNMSWTSENPHSGSKCLKTVVSPGAQSTWLSARQSNIRIVGGAKYTLKGWVKGLNTTGLVGWYIHVGNDSNTMMISPMPTIGGGTFDWKEVVAEFTAPAEANKADLGTVLYGTGTAWFDDVSLETTAKAIVTAEAFAPEKLMLKGIGADAKWPQSKKFGWRVPVTLTNLTSTPVKPGLVSVNLSATISRLRGEADLKTMQVMEGKRLISHVRLVDSVLFAGSDIPANTSKTYFIYLPYATKGKVSLVKTEAAVRQTGTTEDARQNNNAQAFKSAETSKVDYEKLLKSPRNLAKNADFEVGEVLPDEWPGSAEGDKPVGAFLGFDSNALFGKQCLKISVPATSKAAWLGWRQSIPVTPGRTYLYAAWVKCKDTVGDGVQLHAHIRNDKDEVVTYAGTGPAISGTAGWTLISGLFEIPQGASIFQMHLTMRCTGTVWHDGVVFIEVGSGAVGSPQPATSSLLANGLTAWPVNAIKKVFQEDTPPAKISPAQITVAGNEYEPLQIALRSPAALKQVKAVVTLPQDKAGYKLSNVEIGVVGYVPIDHATSYYSSTTPMWYRKYPTTLGSSDGWAGMWPDPLLPKDTFDLKANTTQPVWVTVNPPKGTPAGDYSGKLSFVCNGKTIKQVPFTVHVWGFDLPDEMHTASVYDSGLNDRWQIPGQTSEQTKFQYWEFMAKHRLSPDRIQPEPNITYQNGKVIADFTEFDKAAEYYFNVLKLPHTYTPWYFYMFGWGFPPDAKFGEKPYEGDYPYPDADKNVLRPEFKKAVQSCIKVYWDHMKEKGWDKKVVYYMSDEPFYSQAGTVAQMKALCRMVQEVDPAIPIFSSTWGHVPEWDSYLTMWGIGHFGGVPESTIKKIRSDGARIRFTTDGQMCTDTPYNAIERLLPHYCFKYGVESYEFWGSSWLTYDPYKFGWHSYIHQSDTPGKSYYVRYPNGDGYIAYPGAPIGHNGPVPSIRMEQAREGSEDYEYLYMLQELINKAKAAGKDANVGEKALAYANTLVDMPSAGGQKSTRILPDPDAVLRIKTAVAKAIEAMNR